MFGSQEPMAPHGVGPWPWQVKKYAGDHWSMPCIIGQSSPKQEVDHVSSAQWLFMQHMRGAGARHHSNSVNTQNPVEDCRNSHLR